MIRDAAPADLPAITDLYVHEVLTGTATFLSYPRGIEQLQLEGTNLHFETHTQESVGDKSFDLTHHYSAELRGQPPDEVLALRVHTTGGFGGGRKPLEFEARRVNPTAGAASAAR